MVEEKGKRKIADQWCGSAGSGGVLDVFHLLVQDVSDLGGRVARLEDVARRLEALMLRVELLIARDEETDEWLTDQDEPEPGFTNS